MARMPQTALTMQWLRAWLHPGVLLATFEGHNGWFPVVALSGVSGQTKEFADARAAGRAAFLKSHHSYQVELHPHSVLMLARFSEHLG